MPLDCHHFANGAIITDLFCLPGQVFFVERCASMWYNLLERMLLGEVKYELT